MSELYLSFPKNIVYGWSDRAPLPKMSRKQIYAVSDAAYPNSLEFWWYSESPIVVDPVHHKHGWFSVMLNGNPKELFRNVQAILGESIERRARPVEKASPPTTQRELRKVCKAIAACRDSQ